MNWQSYIHSDPTILLGKPVIKGTRISVELILELLETGWSNQMILDSYPQLLDEHLRAVFAYLRNCIKEELYFPTQSAA